MTVQEGSFFLLHELDTIYDKGEAATIADWVMERVTGSAKAERMRYKNEMLSATEEKSLRNIMARLTKNEPVQYILNEAWFYRYRLYVDGHVLIPRPETEELVEWVLSFLKNKTAPRVLDLGTGSGCIPIAIKKNIPAAVVTAVDISEEALSVAKKNGQQLHASISWQRLDILDASAWNALGQFDVIVSNPPYIPIQEKQQMQPHVTAYEPSIALFVPDEDPLLFYRKIAELGQQHLQKDGAIYCELHENLGEETAALFRDLGYITTIKNDLQGKQRMLMGKRSQE